MKVFVEEIEIEIMPAHEKDYSTHKKEMTNLKAAIESAPANADYVKPLRDRLLLIEKQMAPKEQTPAEIARLADAEKKEALEAFASAQVNVQFAKLRLTVAKLMASKFEAEEKRAESRVNRAEIAVRKAHTVLAAPNGEKPAIEAARVEITIPATTDQNEIAMKNFESHMSSLPEEAMNQAYEEYCAVERAAGRTPSSVLKFVALAAARAVASPLKQSNGPEEEEEGTNDEEESLFEADESPMDAEASPTKRPAESVFSPVRTKRHATRRTPFGIASS